MADLGIVVGLVSAATALVASVAGPLVALHVGRTQVRMGNSRALNAEFCA